MIEKFLKDECRSQEEMLQQKGILLGPASMVCYAGFHKALEEGKIRNGDCILLNTGEGCERASWFRKAVENIMK